MTALIDLLEYGTPVSAQRPWPRHRVSGAVWDLAVHELANGGVGLAALWGDVSAVHMAVYDDVLGQLAVLSLDCPHGRFPSVARAFPPAGRLERAIRDLFGLEPEGAPDARSWLDHGRWGLAAPLGKDRFDANGHPLAYRFLPAEGESLHQIPVGPVHAGIIEPGHFRFTASGETVVRLEERLGYVHKGIEALMKGADLDRATRLAGRLSGDSTVAYAIAFARAVEAALAIEIPPRAVWLRALMAELERMANHLGDIGAICNDAAFAFMHAQCGALREDVLRAGDAWFGHRLLMDRVIPGGVGVDLAPAGVTMLSALVALIRQRLPKLIDIYDNTTSLQDRTVGTGILKPELAKRFGCGGFIGRASGRDFDARKKPSYPPYGELKFDVPVLERGDVDARVWIRFREIEQSLSLVTQILQRLPEGPIATSPEAAVPHRVSEGLALVEGFRGDIFAWVRLHEDLRVERCHLRDPSWFQWPLLEAAIEGNIVADFPLCNKSFNCSYSGHDL